MHVAYLAPDVGLVYRRPCRFRTFFYAGQSNALRILCARNQAVFWVTAARSLASLMLATPFRKSRVRSSCEMARSHFLSGILAPSPVWFLSYTDELFFDTSLCTGRAWYFYKHVYGPGTGTVGTDTVSHVRAKFPRRGAGWGSGGEFTPIDKCW